MPAKPHSTKKESDLPPKMPELLPDAWERFEHAVDRVAKSPPQHKQSTRKAPGSEAERND